ncbi:Flavonoid 3',5'-hydroxylase [Thalictrum thalictroides]|uniref:Flavonoid 3',5'-hydroxylase n=1 Tax=Thalictrum thalictroides TaxID=46969 RepID=A0A7J6V9N6_THATH|nr:Flavonoid 3',5'-hydroxylase [Thalictrum thalictroides]
MSTATYLFFILSSSRSADHRLPPGPKGWPVIGALPLLGNMPHVALAELSNKYGPIMYLKLGACGMVVVSTPDTAREFLKTQDMNFCNRPPFAGSTYLVYNRQDMAFADYGPKWKLLRKLSTLYMLGGKAIEGLASARRVELGHMLKDMYASSCQGERVVVSELCLGTIANLISQVILSRRVFDTKGTGSKEFKDLVDELMELFGSFDIGDFLPSIAWMDIKGLIKRMKNVNKKFDALFEKMFKEHRETKHERLEKPDFLDVLVDQMDNHGEEKLTDANIKALLVNMFTAGTDTTASSIEWALTEMIKNPRIFARAQAEMDQVIGKSRAKMAMVMFENILGTMVHSFDWMVPEEETINMDEAFGLALSKAVPLAAIVTPRLPPSVYGSF